MKKQIKTLETIKDKVTMMYSHTEGVGRNMSQMALLGMLKNVSDGIEHVGGWIDDEIKNLKRTDERKID